VYRHRLCGTRPCTSPRIREKLRCSDGFFGEDNSGKSRFDLLLDSATDSVQWIHDQTTRLEEDDAWGIGFVISGEVYFLSFGSSFVYLWCGTELCMIWYQSRVFCVAVRWYHCYIGNRCHYADSEAELVSFCCSISLTTRAIRMLTRRRKDTFGIGRLSANNLFKVRHILIQKFHLGAVKFDCIAAGLKDYGYI